MSQGGVRCWGSNVNGQLGDGGGGDRGSPPAVDALSGVTAVAAGASHTCALSTDGERPLLGRQRQRPARRRHDHDARDAARRAACSRA